METPIPNNEKKIDTPEQERPVPPGYNSISHGTWLMTSEFVRHILCEGDPDQVQSWLRDLCNYLNIELPLPLFRPLEAMRCALADILVETDFATRVESGEYGIILGEDSSGRVPTLSLAETVRGLCGAKNISVPSVNFYAGLRGAWEEKYVHAGTAREEDKENYEKYLTTKAEWKVGMGEYVQELKRRYLSGENRGKRILLSSETFETGTSVKNMIEVLQENDVPYHVLVFGVYDRQGEGMINLRQMQEHETVYFGKIETTLGFEDIHKNSWLSGIFKENGDVVARPARKLEDLPREYVVRTNRTAQLVSEKHESMKIIRDFAKYVGANVAQAYLDYKAGKFELPTEPK